MINKYKLFLKNTKIGKYIKYNKLKYSIYCGIKPNYKSMLERINSDVIFIHIPKSAGMSIVKSVYGVTYSDHAKAIDYIQMDKELFYSKYSFAMVREPYSRLYSAYNYLMRGGMEVIDEVWRDNYLSGFESFERFINDGGLERAINENAEHFISQCDFLYDGENLLCTEVFQLENIEGLNEKLSKLLLRNIEIKRLNSSSLNEFRIDNVYTREMLDIVNSLYENDFRLLNYNTA